MREICNLRVLLLDSDGKSIHLVRLGGKRVTSSLCLSKPVRYVSAGVLELCTKLPALRKQLLLSSDQSIARCLCLRKRVICPLLRSYCSLLRVSCGSSLGGKRVASGLCLSEP